jgi:hypothetical protein
MSIKNLRRRVDKLCPPRPSDSGTITRGERERAFDLRAWSSQGGLTPAEQEEFAVLSAKLDAEAKANNRTTWNVPLEDAAELWAAVVAELNRNEKK